MGNRDAPSSGIMHPSNVVLIDPGQKDLMKHGGNCCVPPGASMLLALGDQCESKVWNALLDPCVMQPELAVIYNPE